MNESRHSDRVNSVVTMLIALVMAALALIVLFGGR